MTTKCLPWPEWNVYGCKTTEKTHWIPLNISINTSEKTNCDYLCRSRIQDGCCFLNNRSGCYFLPDAEATTLASQSGVDTKGLAITCSTLGKYSVKEVAVSEFKHCHV